MSSRWIFALVILLVSAPHLVAEDPYEWEQHQQLSVLQTGFSSISLTHFHNYFMKEVQPYLELPPKREAKNGEVIEVSSEFVTSVEDAGEPLELRLYGKLGKITAWFTLAQWKDYQDHHGSRERLLDAWQRHLIKEDNGLNIITIGWGKKNNGMIDPQFILNYNLVQMTIDEILRDRPGESRKNRFHSVELIVDPKQMVVLNASPDSIARYQRIRSTMAP